MILKPRLSLFFRYSARLILMILAVFVCFVGFAQLVLAFSDVHSPSLQSMVDGLVGLGRLTLYGLGIWMMYAFWVFSKRWEVSDQGIRISFFGKWTELHPWAEIVHIEKTARGDAFILMLRDRICCGRIISFVDEASSDPLFEQFCRHCRLINAEGSTLLGGVVVKFSLLAGVVNILMASGLGGVVLLIIDPIRGSGEAGTSSVYAWIWAIFAYVMFSLVFISVPFLIAFVFLWFSKRWEVSDQGITVCNWRNRVFLPWSAIRNVHATPLLRCCHLEIGWFDKSDRDHKLYFVDRPIFQAFIRMFHRHHPMFANSEHSPPGK